jgi:hypothetical protein
VASNFVGRRLINKLTLEYDNGCSVIVWDLETVPDLRGFATANDFEGKSDDEIRAAMGDRFPKHIYHQRVKNFG